MDEASNLGGLLSNYVYSQTRLLAVDGFIQSDPTSALWKQWRLLNIVMDVDNFRCYSRWVFP